MRFSPMSESIYVIPTFFFGGAKKVVFGARNRKVSTGPGSPGGVKIGVFWSPGGFLKNPRFSQFTGVNDPFLPPCAQIPENPEIPEKFVKKVHFFDKKLTFSDIFGQKCVFF